MLLVISWYYTRTKEIAALKEKLRVILIVLIRYPLFQKCLHAAVMTCFGHICSIISILLWITRQFWTTRKKTISCHYIHIQKYIFNQAKELNIFNYNYLSGVIKICGVNDQQKNALFLLNHQGLRFWCTEFWEFLGKYRYVFNITWTPCLH